jgi:hypothetical protein
MSKPFISDDLVDGNFQWLEENAEKAAAARADRVYLEAYTKPLKALLMKECDDDMPVSKQDRDALADKRYLQHLEGLRDAVYNDELLRWRKEKKLAEIEAWRTASSNRRHQI